MGCLPILYLTTKSEFAMRIFGFCDILRSYTAYRVSLDVAYLFSRKPAVNIWGSVTNDPSKTFVPPGNS